MSLHPARFDPARPENARKLEATFQLGELADEIGISLVELSVAWTLQHPAITSVIIGPRDLPQLEGQINAPSIDLGSDVLDRIDEIVAPGENLNPLDAGWVPAAISEPSLRRGGGDPVRQRAEWPPKSR